MRFTDSERRTLLAGLFVLQASRADDEDVQIRGLVHRLGGDVHEAFFWREAQ
jgi:hypothetical protein